MRILTGIQPSGTPHIGNYFGAMRQIINIQEKGETFVFLADYHSLTTSPEPEQLRKNVFELALNFLSCGVPAVRCSGSLRADLDIEQCDAGRPPRTRPQLQG